MVQGGRRGSGEKGLDSGDTWEVKPIGWDVGVREAEESRMIPVVVTWKRQPRGWKKHDETSGGEIRGSVWTALSLRCLVDRNNEGAE